MRKNMSTADRATRIVIAAIIIALYFTKVINGTTATVLLAVATIFALTSLISFCPLYSLAGISTCRKK